MANYVEKIQVGVGEAWPLRDSDAHTRIDSTNAQIDTNRNEFIRLMGDTETLINNKHNEALGLINENDVKIQELTDLVNEHEDEINLMIFDDEGMLLNCVDYPIARGGTNGWHYTKWSSGRFEATYCMTETYNNESPYPIDYKDGSCYYSPDRTIFCPDICKTLTYYNVYAHLNDNHNHNITSNITMIFHYDDPISWEIKYVLSSPEEIMITGAVTTCARIEGYWK